MTKEGYCRCGGDLYLPKVENCSCHINPPCSQCTSNLYQCWQCGETTDEPLYEGDCIHQYVDVGFTISKIVCKYCDKIKQ